MPSYVQFVQSTATTVDTPAAGRINVFADVSGGGISYVDASGVAHAITAATNQLPGTITLGDIFSVSGGVVVTVTGNVSTTQKFLTQTGTGTGAAVPAWNAIAESNLPVPAISSLTSATNITWDVGSARDCTANVTISVAVCTLTLTNVAVGVAGMIRITAGVTSPSLTLPAGSIQVGGGGTAAAISTGTVGLVDLLGFIAYATGNYIWTVGKGAA